MYYNGLALDSALQVTYCIILYSRLWLLDFKMILMLCENTLPFTSIRGLQRAIDEELCCFKSLPKIVFPILFKTI